MAKATRQKASDDDVRMPKDFEEHVAGLERFVGALREMKPSDPVITKWHEAALESLLPYLDAIGAALRLPDPYERLLELRLQFMSNMAGADSDLIHATITDALMRRAIRALASSAPKVRQGILAAAVIALRSLGRDAKPRDVWRWIERQKIVITAGYKVAIVDGAKIRQTKPGGKSYQPITQKRFNDAYLPLARQQVSESLPTNDSRAKPYKK